MVRIFHIPIRRLRERFTGVAANAVRGADLAADVSGIHLIHDVAERRKLIFAVIAVNAIVDGDEANVVIGEVRIRVIPDLQIIAPEAAHVLHDDGGDVAHFNVLQQLLKAGTVEIGAGVPVIHIVSSVAEVILFGIFLKHPLLIGDGIAVALGAVVSGQTAVKRGNSRVLRFLFRLHSVLLSGSRTGIFTRQHTFFRKG